MAHHPVRPCSTSFLPDRSSRRAAAAAHYVVVGASAAGVSAALAMRDHGFTGRITVLEASAHTPYERPPLSKSFTDLDTVRPIVSVGTYVERGIDLQLGVRVAALDPDSRTVLLDDGRRLAADAVLLATGVSARTLDIPGSDLHNVLTLRDLEDARRIGALLEAGGPLVLIGAGFIGLEAASVGRARGLDVTLVDTLPIPLLPVLGAEGGALIQRLHEDRGVSFALGRGVSALTGDAAVEQIVLTDGTTLAASTVVVGCGVVPNDALARAAGVHCRGGVVVDVHGRTSNSWIWAAGDVASMINPYVDGRQRIEHWDVALRHGAVVGANMAGADTEHVDVPYFWSDQYGLRLQMYGRGRPGDEIVVRQDSTPEQFLLFWLRGGHLVAAAGMDAAKDLRAAKQLIETGCDLSDEVLADPNTALRALGRSVARQASVA